MGQPRPFRRTVSSPHSGIGGRHCTTLGTLVQNSRFSIVHKGEVGIRKEPCQFTFRWFAGPGRLFRTGIGDNCSSTRSSLFPALFAATGSKPFDVSPRTEVVASLSAIRFKPFRFGMQGGNIDALRHKHYPTSVDFRKLA